MVYVLSVGAILLVLGGVLLQLVQRHREEITHFSESQSAIYLAEAGVGFTIQEVRRLFEEENVGGTTSELAKLLLQPGPVPETSILPYFDDSWSYNLGLFAGEVDRTASIRVSAWFEKCEAAENEVEEWVDPLAKRGLLTIQAVAKFRGVTRTVTAKRPIYAGNMLPPVVTKFSLRVQDASRGKPERFNTMCNDYDGRYTEGDRPLVVYSHSLPDDPFSPQPYQEKEAQKVYEKRGWVWIGGGPVRLHITSGAKEMGEIFQLYQITEPGKFKVIKFCTSPTILPAAFHSTLALPWDKPNGALERTTEYRFGHSFILDGFHDKSSSMEHHAMYEGNLLSTADLDKYGSKASSLHLFGDCRKGYQSRTKVLGNVRGAFLRFAKLEVEPQEPDVKAIFSGVSPDPLYFLPCLGPSLVVFDLRLREFQSRSVGGPIVTLGSLFPQYDPYSENMSRIIEFPYAEMYNFMGETGLPSDARYYPPAENVLRSDEGEELDLRRRGEQIFRGSVAAPRVNNVIQKRVQVEILTIAKFWERYYRRNERILRLNTTVRILNPDREPFIIPPETISAPLDIDGSGLILLDQGNVVCHGEKLRNIQSALTIVAPNAGTVTLENYDQHQINIVAPNAALSIQDPCKIYGSVDVGDVLQTNGAKGGSIAYREIQDPTRDDILGKDYRQFYRACLAESDRWWHD